jgi:hypothetical protein
MATKTALETVLLPQYQESMAFMERFLVAAHREGEPVERAPNDQRIKLVDGNEIDADALSYFFDNRDAMRTEFIIELRDRIGPNCFDEFCDVVANEWFDGTRLRYEGRSRRLKRSVRDYLRTLLGDSFAVGNLVQVNDSLQNIKPLIPIKAVGAIVTVNMQMLYRHVEAWKKQHPNNDFISTDTLFIRRGLALQNKLQPSSDYREWDFINSYSIAFSAPERFARMMQGHTPAIVNGDLGLFEERVLFFAPFVPGMEIGQLELGIIPSLKPLPIHFQGEHAGILEYIIDPVT